MGRTRVRWGRLAIVLAVAVTAWIGSLRLSAGPASAMPVAHMVHVVAPGETVWSIALKLVGPGGDPRPMVDQILSLNHVRADALQPGSRLVLPPG